jgi:ATP-dependent DNA ligase
MQLEGIVSKHRRRGYRAKTCDWIKFNNLVTSRHDARPGQYG